MDLSATEIESVISNAIERALAKKHLECACGLSTEAQHELSHLMGVVKYIGGEGQDGYAKGVEMIRDNNKFIMRLRNTCEKTGSLVLCAVVVGTLGIAAAIGGAGWWAWIKRGGETITK